MNPRIHFVPAGWRVGTVGKELLIENHLREPINENKRAEMSGPYPYYGPTKAVDSLDHYRVEGTYALIGEDGDHFLKYADQDMTQLVGGRFNVNNHAHLVRGNGECTTEWFFEYFRHRALTPYLTRQGVGRYKLNKSSLEQLPILVPPKAEQQQIHAVLREWDRCIDLIQRLLDAKRLYRKGVMQKLLKGQVRIPPYTRPWRRQQLKFLMKELSARNRQQAITRVLSVTNDKGFVLPEERFSRSIASKDLGNYKIVRKGQFAYNPSRINVGSIARLDSYDEGVISPMYVVFEVQRGLDPSFFGYWLQSHEGCERIRMLAQGSVRHTVSFSDLASTSLSLPDVDEQMAIADLLGLADREINLLEQVFVNLGEQKRGLMQQLLTGRRRVNVTAAA